MKKIQTHIFHHRYIYTHIYTHPHKNTQKHTQTEAKLKLRNIHAMAQIYANK